MQAVSIRIVAVAVSIFLTSCNLCIAAETPVKKILTSFVSCQVSNTALDKAGISAKTLMDANSNPMVAAKVLSLLHDSNSAKLLANPKMLTLDGEAARIEVANIKIDLTASIQEKSSIIINVDWQKVDINSPDVESVKTRVELHSGKPFMLSCGRVFDQTRFLIVTSEILDPNKPKANSTPAGRSSIVSYYPYIPTLYPNYRHRIKCASRCDQNPKILKFFMISLTPYFIRIYLSCCPLFAVP